MKKFSIFGSVGYNIGDEAIAVSAAEFIASLNSDCVITVSTLKKGVIKSRYDNINEFFMNRKRLSGWIELYKQIKESDVIILGGGTMVQDKLGVSLIRGMIPYMYQITAIAKMLNKPIYTLPIGVDHLNTNLGKWLAKRFLQRVDNLIVRDEKSKKLALKYAKGSVSPNVSADPAFFLPSSENYTPFLNTQYITISLVNENLDKTTFLPAIIDSVNWILENTEYSIVLVPMDRREEEELCMFKELVSSVDRQYQQRILISDPSLDVYQISDLLRGAELLIGMRLHAMILSLGYTPIIGISRTTKTENLLNEFYIPYLDINKEKINPSDLLELVERNLNIEEQKRNKKLKELKCKIELKRENFIENIPSL